MPVDKQGLLDAIAQAGKAGGDAYRAAQSDLAAQSQAAIRQALGGSFAQSVPTEGQNQLAATIAAPYQQRTAQLTANNATNQDYYAKLGAAAGTFTDQANALGPALQQQYEQNLALKMAGSGSGGAAPKPTQLELRGQIEQAARAQADPNTPWWMTAQKIAAENGISSKDAQLWFQPSAEYASALKNNTAELAKPVAGTGRALTPLQARKIIAQNLTDQAEAAQIAQLYGQAYTKRYPNVVAQLAAGKKPLQNKKLIAAQKKK